LIIILLYICLWCFAFFPLPLSVASNFEQDGVPDENHPPNTKHENRKLEEFHTPQTNQTNYNDSHAPPSMPATRHGIKNCILLANKLIVFLATSGDCASQPKFLF